MNDQFRLRFQVPFRLKNCCLLLSKLSMGSGVGESAMLFCTPNVALPSFDTYRYDPVSLSASIACQSAPTPIIHVWSLVCEFQL